MRLLPKLRATPSEGDGPRPLFGPPPEVLARRDRIDDAIEAERRKPRLARIATHVAVGASAFSAVTTSWSGHDIFSR